MRWHTAHRRRALMLHGRRSTEALVMTLGSRSEDADTLMRTHVSRVRGKLKHIDAPLAIKNVFGWDYELVPLVHHRENND